MVSDWPLRASVKMTALSKPSVTMVIGTREVDESIEIFRWKKKKKEMMKGKERIIREERYCHFLASGGTEGQHGRQEVVFHWERQVV